MESVKRLRSALASKLRHHTTVSDPERQRRAIPHDECKWGARLPFLGRESVGG